MATIRRVPEVYPTIQAAHDAAAAGDTILIAPGTYPITSFSNKLVHIKGDADDPLSVVLTTSNNFSLGYTGAEPQWVEGVRINLGYSDELVVAGTHVLNRVDFGGAPFTGITASNAGVSLRMLNCNNQGRPVSYMFQGWFGAGSIEVIKSRLRTDILSTQLHWFAVADYVTTPTEGYGPAYGEWYAPQFEGRAYGFGNTLLLADGQHDRAQILLYRVLDDGGPDSPAALERYAWLTTRPDPVTGYWEFRYLPTLRADGSPQRYAYTIWTPEGYGPQTHGRYLPAPAP
jgi:hypothetical protein